MHTRCPERVKGGHAEHVAAATGSPQKAALLAAVGASGSGQYRSSAKCRFLIIEHKKKDRLAAVSLNPISRFDQAARLNASIAA
jgi:hypothetical protein